VEFVRRNKPASGEHLQQITGQSNLEKGYWDYTIEISHTAAIGIVLASVP
jgi:hypothetical protein